MIGPNQQNFNNVPVLGSKTIEGVELPLDKTQPGQPFAFEAPMGAKILSLEAVPGQAVIMWLETPVSTVKVKRTFVLFIPQMQILKHRKMQYV